MTQTTKSPTLLAAYDSACIAQLAAREAHRAAERNLRLAEAAKDAAEAALAALVVVMQES